MKRFNVMLSDEDRVLLDRHRQRLGLKTEADAIRWLIAQDFLQPSPTMRPATPLPPTHFRQNDTDW